MLHVVAWLAAYAVVLIALAGVIYPFCRRAWFKIAFFPGTLLAVVVQALAAKLFLGGRLKFSLTAPGRPAIFVENTNVPYLGGGLFVIVSHGLLFLVFFFAVKLVERVWSFDSQLILLPDLYPHERLEEYFDVLEGHTVALENQPKVTGTDYAASIEDSAENFMQEPLPYLLLFYLVAPVFANLRLRVTDLLWAAVLLVVLCYSVYFSDSFRLGLPARDEDEWARLFYFPEWWGIFSLYVTLVMATFSLSLAPAIVGRMLLPLMGPRRPTRKPPPAGAKAPTRVAVPARPAGGAPSRSVKPPPRVRV